MVREMSIVRGEGTCPVQHGKTKSWFVISLQMLEKENNQGSKGSLNSGTKLKQEQVVAIWSQKLDCEVSKTQEDCGSEQTVRSKATD